MKTSAFLVREEGFDLETTPIVFTGFCHGTIAVQRMGKPTKLNEFLL
jgi:hypothetical protein